MVSFTRLFQGSRVLRSLRWGSQAGWRTHNGNAQTRYIHTPVARPSKSQERASAVGNSQMMPSARRKFRVNLSALLGSPTSGPADSLVLTKIPLNSVTKPLRNHRNGRRLKRNQAKGAGRRGQHRPKHVARGNTRTGQEVSPGCPSTEHHTRAQSRVSQEQGPFREQYRSVVEGSLPRLTSLSMLSSSKPSVAAMVSHATSRKRAVTRGWNRQS